MDKSNPIRPHPTPHTHPVPYVQSDYRNFNDSGIEMASFKGRQKTQRCSVRTFLTGRKHACARSIISKHRIQKATNKKKKKWRPKIKRAEIKALSSNISALRPIYWRVCTALKMPCRPINTSTPWFKKTAWQRWRGHEIDAGVYVYWYLYISVMNTYILYFSAWLDLQRCPTLNMRGKQI